VLTWPRLEKAEVDPIFLGSTKYWLIATMHIQLSSAAIGSVGFRIGLSLWVACVGGEGKRQNKKDSLMCRALVFESYGYSNVHMHTCMC
jgi:hypothetical protein